MNARTWLVAATLCLMASSGLVVGEEIGAQPTSTTSEAEGPFEVTGDFGVGLRVVDTSGNGDKFAEDLNYQTGPRLFNLNLDVTPVGSSFFNVLNVYASHLGGDPYEYFGITVKKFGSYNFRYRRNESTYFYRDNIRPVGVTDLDEPLDPSRAWVGDFHTFNFDRLNDSIDFDFNVAERGKVFLQFNRQERVGESTTTLDVSRDEFELDEPLRQKKDDYTVGFQIAANRVSFYFDQTYRDYDDDGRIFLPGASPGESVEDDATELFFFEQLLPFDFTSPQSTVRVNLRPSSRLTVNFGYIYSTLDGEFDYSEVARGIAFTGQPLDENMVGSGELDRTTNLFDVDVVYDVNDHVSALAGARVRRFDQRAELRCILGPCVESELDAGELVDTSWDIASDIFELGARVYPSAGYQVTGGLRFENRDTTTATDGVSSEEPNTDRRTFFVNGVVSTSEKYNVMAEYELGDYDNPFTLVSPTSLDRFKLRLRLFPIDGLTVTGMAHIRRLERAADVSVRGETSLTDAEFGTDHYSVYVRYALEDMAAYGGYTRQEFSGDITNEIRTAPGFLGGLTFPIASIYDYGINNVSGGFNYGFTELVRAGVDVNVYDNSGSFGLDWRQFQFFGDFLSPAGYLVRLAYQRNSYDEVDFDFDDYSSNIFTVSIGYRF